ncbi:MAG: (2Fe-2S)-binding protein [Acidaminobacteraceae bacterium]
MNSYKGYFKANFNINGESRSAVIKPSDTLLSVLREKFGLTGAKAGCENGDCGACTILLEDKPVKSCMLLAIDGIDKKIVTIEGLKDTAVQMAYQEEGGFQCGFCTSGFLLNSFALLNDNPNCTDEDAKEYLQSNICRCTGYEGIKKSIDKAKEIINGK